MKLGRKIAALAAGSLIGMCAHWGRAGTVIGGPSPLGNASGLIDDTPYPDRNVAGMICLNQDQHPGSRAASPSFWILGATMTASGAVADAFSADKYFTGFAPSTSSNASRGTTVINGTPYRIIDVTADANAGHDVFHSFDGGNQFNLNATGTITLRDPDANSSSGGSSTASGSGGGGGDGGAGGSKSAAKTASSSTGKNLVSRAGNAVASGSISTPDNTQPDAVVNGITPDVTGPISIAPAVVDTQTISGGSGSGTLIVQDSQPNDTPTGGGGGGTQGEETPLPSTVLAGVALLAGMLAVGKLRPRRRVA